MLKRIREALDRWGSFQPRSGSCQIRGIRIDADAGPMRRALCDWAPFAHTLPADEPIKIFDAPDYYDESLRSWFKRMEELWGALSPKAADYVANSPFYADQMEAMGHQLQVGKKLRDQQVLQNWLDESIRERRDYWFYTVPSKGYSIKFAPKNVENILRWWGERPNVIRAELTIAELDQAINQRTSFGLRGRLATSPGHVLMWSNNLATWRIAQRRYQEGEEVRLDANEVYAPYDDHELLWMIRDHLAVLPLYYTSIEAKSKGHIGWDEANKIWDILQTIRLEGEKKRETQRQVLVPHVEQRPVGDLYSINILEQKIEVKRIPGTDIEVTPTMTLDEYYEEMKKSIERMNCEELYNNLDLARTTRNSIYDPQMHFLLTAFISEGSRKLQIECPSWHDKLKEKYIIKDIESLATPWKWP